MTRLFQIACLAVAPTNATAEPALVAAGGTVAETVARLGTSVEGAGARVFHNVDFVDGAKSVGTDSGEI